MTTPAGCGGKGGPAMHAPPVFSAACSPTGFETGRSTLSVFGNVLVASVLQVLQQVIL
jgi:predicted naringenin-chalcone synthase